MTEDNTLFDVAVVGGGPAGATAAHDLARSGRNVALLDKSGRIKPCGGAIPPRLIEEFDIPAPLLVARITSARMVAPSASSVDIPIENGFVGMVDREVFDPWLRSRAAGSGAHCVNGDVDTIVRDADGHMTIIYRSTTADASEPPRKLRARMVIGADGANSKIARLAGLDRDRMKYVFAYHEIVRSPQTDASSAPRHGTATFDSARCDVIYRGSTSPDFYSWIFPHGDTTSIGTGSAEKGFALREAVSEVRRMNGLDGQATIRREGAPIPMRPLKRWDNGS
ncbi:MAG TPA: geranylgeranyl reductase family protein, partial [Hyphomicrobiaceae bacterium]|nr:geranylgeranyl reductase family protein [Hyphomicrobiaceae bacterium]